MGRGRSQNSLAKSSSGSSMGARHHQRPNSIGRDEFDDGGENQFVTNYEAEMSALKPRETFTLSPIKKDPEMSYVEPVVNQGKIKKTSTNLNYIDIGDASWRQFILVTDLSCHQLSKLHIAYPNWYSSTSSPSWSSLFFLLRILVYAEVCSS